jgi:hypothetical protein
VTRDEFKILVKAMKAVYTYATFLPDKDAFEVWYALLKDIDYKTASSAVQKYMMTKKTPPTIADIREQCDDINGVPDLNEQAAWALVSKAVRNSAYGAQEEFDRLPSAVKEAIGSPSRLREMASNEDFNEGVESSNFMRVYSVVLKRQKDMRLVSPRVRELVEKRATVEKLSERSGND